MYVFYLLHFLECLEMLFDRPLAFRVALVEEDAVVDGVFGPPSAPELISFLRLKLLRGVRGAANQSPDGLVDRGLVELPLFVCHGAVHQNLLFGRDGEVDVSLDPSEEERRQDLVEGRSSH